MKGSVMGRTQRALIAAAIAILLSGGAIAAAPAHAVDDYNVGDRVEFDPLKIGKFERGVVIAENDASYLVRADARNGVPGGEYTMPKTADYLAAMRPSSAPLPTDQQKNTSQPTGILTCPYEKGVSTRKIDRTTISGLIRCLYEVPVGQAASDPTRFDIKSMKIGGTRPWRVNIDVGAGDLDTRIYPVKVKWKQTTWTTSEVQTRTGTSIFGCFYSTLDEWECGLNQRGPESDIVRQPR